LRLSSACPIKTVNSVSLASFRGQRVVIYFYPKDDTPGCTKEACNFRRPVGEL